MVTNVTKTSNGQIQFEESIFTVYLWASQKYLISFSIIPYFHKYSTLQYQTYTYVTKKYFKRGVVSAESLVIFHNLLGYCLSMRNKNWIPLRLHTSGVIGLKTNKNFSRLNCPKIRFPPAGRDLKLFGWSLAYLTARVTMIFY